MRGTRAKATALLAALQLTATVALAQSPGIEGLFPARPTGYVTDQAGIVDPAAAAEMNSLIERLRAATGAEIAVVTLPTIGDYDAADVALAIGRSWGVGARADIGDPRRNAGIVLLVVPRIDHQPGTGHVRIEVGQGLEGIVTDAAAGRIRRDLMGPDLAREAYGQALLTGVRALVGLIARGYGVTDSTLVSAAPPPPAEGQGSQLRSLLPVLLLVLFVVLANRGGRRRRRVYWGVPGSGAAAGVAEVALGAGAVAASVVSAGAEASVGAEPGKILMHDAINRVVSPFLAEADGALGAAYSAVLYGSGARGDFVPGRSDINLMLILDDLSPPVLRALGRAFAGWRKTSYEPPLLVSRAEWRRATDTFPIEITDMRVAYRVLRGADPVAGLQVDRADLRRALEREFRGKLLRLRQGYAAVAADPAALGELAGKSAGTVMVLLRGLLALLDRKVPGDPLELAAAAAAVLGVEGEHLLHVVRHRSERGWRCAAPEFEQYMDAVAHAARFADQLQLGDL